MLEPLLKRFPALRTRDVEEMRAWLEPMLSLRGIDMPQAGQRFDCMLNHCQLRDISLVYAQYGSPFTMRLQQNDFFLHGFPLTGAGEATCNGQHVVVRPETGGIVAGPHSHASLRYDESFSHLVLKISPAALTRRLSLLLGKPVDPPLELTGRIRPTAAAAQLRLVKFLAEEVDRSEERLPDMMLCELEDAVVLNYLLNTEHNYSGLLAGAPPAAAPWQVRRAVDYMEQHWGEAITIEMLTQITETSARSLFQLFKKTHDVSPMVYLSQVRMRHAKAMLSSPAPETSVTKVGFLCGFSNMGNFAMKYFSAFGEKPSHTLRNSLR